MNVIQRRQIDTNRREGITLIEVMLVLVILVLVAATVWPSLERSFADQRLRDATGMVSAQWARARAKATSSGIAYQFCYRPEDSSFWIEPCEEMAASLDEAAMNQLCRERGLYAHHMAQWKQDFISAVTANERSDAKGLKGEVRELKKELNRKDRALAETAALLVLQKKVSAIWGNDEANSR